MILIKDKLVEAIDKGKDNAAGLVHYIAMYVVFGKAVSNTKSNINDSQSKGMKYCTCEFFWIEKTVIFVSGLVDRCKDVSRAVVKLLTAWQTGSKIEEYREDLKKAVNDVESMALSTQATESLGDLVEDELSTMDKAIEEAAVRIQVSVIAND